jgi:hypothetical protein
MNLGCFGSASKYLRRRTMKLSMVRDDVENL